MKKINQYRNLVQFLGESLGLNHEIVLHVIEENQSYIAEIANSHVSGRTKNSPLTSFALELIQKKEYEHQDFVTNYKAKVTSGNYIQGSTFFIKDEDNNLEGMLCINTDYTKYKEIAEEVLKLGNIMNARIGTVQANEPQGELLAVPFEENGEEYVEALSNNIKDVIKDLIDPSILDENVTLNQDSKIRIVEQLEKKGVFQLKGAVSQVADILKVSEPSIYRYLRIVTKAQQA